MCAFVCVCVQAITIPMMHLHLKWIGDHDFGALHRSIPWCRAAAAAYTVGVVADVVDLVDARGERMAFSCFVTACSDVLSLAMWVNIIYYLTILPEWLRLRSESEITTTGVDERLTPSSCRSLG